MMEKKIIKEVIEMRKMVSIRESYWNKEREYVVNKLLDIGDFSDLAKSLMFKLTKDVTIGQLTDEERELYYHTLRGSKKHKKSEVASL